jgi:hypothetical protein
MNESRVGDAVSNQVLVNKLGALADRVVADPEWTQDDLAVSVLGMLLYGLALAEGRAVMLLDLDDIDAAVLACLTKHVGAAHKWSNGLVASARVSAFDQAHHPGQHELIGVGHSYFGIQDCDAVVSNVLANVESVRRRASGARE